MFHLRIKISVLALILLQSINIFAQSGSGGWAGSVLQRNVGIRAIGLGGAFTAISNDPTTIFYNPGGLSFSAPSPIISADFSYLGFNRTQSALFYSQSFNDFGIGAGINSFSTFGINGLNQRGESIGEFSDLWFNFNLGASYSTNFAGFGFNVKYLNNSLVGSGIGGSGIAFDFGSRFNIVNLFTFGVAIQNVAGQIKYNTRRENQKIPYTIRSGIAFEIPLSEPQTIVYRNYLGETDSLIQPSPEYILVTLEGKFIQYQKHPTLIVGVEFTPIEYLAIRGGIAFVGDKFGEFRLLPMTEYGFGISVKPNLAFFENLLSIDFSVGNDYIAQYKLIYSFGLSLQF